MGLTLFYIFELLYGWLYLLTFFLATISMSIGIIKLISGVYQEYLLFKKKNKKIKIN
jgi:hypothetical protein